MLVLCWPVKPMITRKTSQYKRITRTLPWVGLRKPKPVSLLAMSMKAQQLLSPSSSKISNPALRKVHACPYDHAMLHVVTWSLFPLHVVTELHLPATLSKDERAFVHDFCRKQGLVSKSTGYAPACWARCASLLGTGWAAPEPSPSPAEPAKLSNQFSTNQCFPTCSWHLTHTCRCACAA